MTHTGDARAAILARIQQANGNANGLPKNSRENDLREASLRSLPRAYTQAGTLSREAMLGLFEHRLEDYGAHVLQAGAAELPETIRRVLAERAKHNVVVAGGVPEDWLPENIRFHEDRGIGIHELSLYDGVVTGATVAIAATGTIVLQNAAGQGRRALSLVPDYHLCIVQADQVVETVPEAFARLSETSLLPTTFISGPSATADIEMTRIQGVHGPRVLDVILLNDRERALLRPG